jgi:16S rRNA (cytosine1407-C5)-methyltransferase
MQKIPSRSFRLVCQPQQIAQVEALLHAQGYAFEPEPFSPWCRKLTAEPKPLGSSLAALFGYVYIQDRSSMLPPLALAPQQGSAVLDMCASPGSKTGFLAQLVGSTGFVLGNEPGKARLATLRANLHCLNLAHAATCSYGGEALPLKPASWDCIQLDPPCSGWGTVEKNPQVMQLWHGEKTRPLIYLQRQLLAKAYELLRPGGIVVYSTCTTNVEENEEQVRYAVEELGFVVEPLPPFEGFAWEEPAQGGAGTLRVDGANSDAQGFYIARLRKPETEYTAFSLPEQDGLPAFDTLPLSALAAPCSDPSLLPPGQVVVFGEHARFVPQLAAQCLSAGFIWQGALLGKMRAGALSLAPRLRLLMPSTPPAEALQLDDVGTIQSLLTGCSYASGLCGRETGLYWQGLPLCRVSLKNGRVICTIK